MPVDSKPNPGKLNNAGAVTIDNIESEQCKPCAWDPEASNGGVVGVRHRTQEPDRPSARGDISDRVMAIPGRVVEARPSLPLDLTPKWARSVEKSRVCLDSEILDLSLKSKNNNNNRFAGKTEFTSSEPSGTNWKTSEKVCCIASSKSRHVASSAQEKGENLTTRSSTASVVMSSNVCDVIDLTMKPEEIKIMHVKNIRAKEFSSLNQSDTDTSRDESSAHNLTKDCLVKSRKPEATQISHNGVYDVRNDTRESNNSRPKEPVFCKEGKSKHENDADLPTQRQPSFLRKSFMSSSVSNLPPVPRTNKITSESYHRSTPDKGITTTRRFPSILSFSRKRPSSTSIRPPRAPPRRYNVMASGRLPPNAHPHATRRNYDMGNHANWSEKGQHTFCSLKTGGNFEPTIARLQQLEREISLHRNRHVIAGKHRQICLTNPFPRRGQPYRGFKGQGDGALRDHHQLTDFRRRGKQERCARCKRTPAPFLCSGCKVNWYCRKDCQLKDWILHSEVCLSFQQQGKRLIKEKYPWKTYET